MECSYEATKIIFPSFVLSCVAIGIIVSGICFMCLGIYLFLLSTTGVKI